MLMLLNEIAEHITLIQSHVAYGQGNDVATAKDREEDVHE